MITKKIIYAVCMVLTGCLVLSGTYARDAESVPVSGAVRVVTLDNGIPVYVKKNTANRILSITIAVNGGTGYLTPETSGLENALFSMMTRGSEKYSYEQLQQMQYRMGFGISPSSSREGASLSAGCIDYYFDKVLPVLIDAFMNPSYNEDQYKTMMTGYREAMQAYESDPESMLSYSISQTLFKDHPYMTSSQVKPYSIDNMTIDRMKALHDKDMDARRIFVVAVGNFDAEKLARRLNSTLGTIARQTYELKSQHIPPLTVSGEPVVSVCDAAEGTAYVEHEYAGPSWYGEDAAAASIAASMYSDVLYSVVREKHGSVYSVYAFANLMEAGLAGTYFYRVSDPARIVSYEKDAREIFASGKMIDGKNPDGSFRYSSVADRIEGYKNKYLNSFYGSSVTNSAVAGRILTSLFVFGDPYSYDRKIEQVADVTACEVEEAFKKYWVDTPGRWFAAAGKESGKKLVFDDK